MKEYVITRSAEICSKNESLLFDTDVLKARRLAREMAAGLGFDKFGLAEIETSTSELATNLLSTRP